MVGGPLSAKRQALHSRAFALLCEALWRLLVWQATSRAAETRPLDGRRAPQDVRGQRPHGQGLGRLGRRGARPSS
eukprot:15462132-Alexandrium_andersonii.AAC.1